MFESRTPVRGWGDRGIFRGQGGICGRQVISRGDKTGGLGHFFPPVGARGETPVGYRGKAPIGGLGDEVPQKLTKALLKIIN